MNSDYSNSFSSCFSLISSSSY